MNEPMGLRESLTLVENPNLVIYQLHPALVLPMICKHMYMYVVYVHVLLHHDLSLLTLTDNQ